MLDLNRYLQPLKTPVKLLSLLVLSNQALATEVKFTLISQSLMDSTHIIKGTLLHSDSAFKDSVEGHWGESNQPAVFTTYTFSIDEVIKGQYKTNTIEVTVKGGCDSELNLCEDFYIKNDFTLEQQEILFLDFSPELNSYQLAQNSNDNHNTRSEKSFINSGQRNQMPIAFISGVSCFELQCLADGSNSYDPDGFLTAFSWFLVNPNGGGGASNAFNTYIFNVPSPGSYLVDLTVFDNNGASSFRHNVVFNVPSPPPVIDEDDFDDVALRGYDDDYEGDAESIVVGQTHTHNFHDAGDEDWSMFWSPNPKAMKFQTQLIGANADTTLDVFKVTDVRVNPNYPNQSRFIIDDMELVATDNSSGSSTVTFNTEAQFLYVMKTASRTNSFGNDTDYTLTSSAVPIAVDDYDNISIRGYNDDYSGDATPISASSGQTQIHNFHDNGDTDWTMVWSSAVNTMQFSAEMIGANSDAKIAVYKVTDVILNPNYPGQNRFIINDMDLINSSNSVGNSSLTFTTEANFLYVMKTESRTNSSGAGTEYRSRLSLVNN